MPNYKKIFAALLFLIFLTFPLATFALFGCRELEVPIPGLTSTCLPALPDYIATIFKFSLMIIGILVFGALIYGGFRYLTSAGNPSAITDAKDQIFSAFLGLIILFSAWLILNTINPELVVLSQPGTTSCDSDTPCPAAGQTCVGFVGNIVQGTCVTYPPLSCTADINCPTNLRCQPPGGGFCVECININDCSTGLICDLGFCKIDTTQNEQNWTPSCSSLSSGDCGKNASCRLCPKCSSNGLYIGYENDKCITDTETCAYTCVVDKCGKTSCP